MLIILYIGWIIRIKSLWWSSLLSSHLHLAADQNNPYHALQQCHIKEGFVNGPSLTSLSLDWSISSLLEVELLSSSSFELSPSSSSDRSVPKWGLLANHINWHVYWPWFTCAHMVGMSCCSNHNRTSFFSQSPHFIHHVQTFMEINRIGILFRFSVLVHPSSQSAK